MKILLKIFINFYISINGLAQKRLKPVHGERLEGVESDDDVSKSMSLENFLASVAWPIKNIIVQAFREPTFWLLWEWAMVLKQEPSARPQAEPGRLIYYIFYIH